MTAPTQEQHDQQNADIAAAWRECRMMRFPEGGNGVSFTKFHILMVDTGRVIADFHYDENEGGSPVMFASNAITSQVGERITERDLKKDGWLPGRDVRFNTITGDIETVIPARRTRKSKDE